MKTELRSIFDYGLPETAALLNLGFSDYFIPIELTLPGFVNMVRTEGIDLAASRVIAAEGDAVGIALIARRGWTSRLAAMSVAPAGRGQGTGRAAVELLLAEAAARGDRRMVLEVIKSNHPAVHLYETCGFKMVRRLVGYELHFPEIDAPSEIEEVDIRDVARLVTMYGLDNLPWQISGESLAQSNPPGRAYHQAGAYLVLSDPSKEQIAVRSIIVLPEQRRQGQAARLLRAVLALHPGKKWVVPALCPAEIGGLFEQEGFQPGKLAQFQMERGIEPG